MIKFAKLFRAGVFLMGFLITSHSRADCYQKYQDLIEEAQESTTFFFPVSRIAHGLYYQRAKAARSTIQKAERIRQLIRDAYAGKSAWNQRQHRNLERATGLPGGVLRAMIKAGDQDGSLCPRGRPLSYGGIVNAILEGRLGSEMEMQVFE